MDQAEQKLPEVKDRRNEIKKVMAIVVTAIALILILNSKIVLGKKSYNTHAVSEVLPTLNFSEKPERELHKENQPKYESPETSIFEKVTDGGHNKETQEESIDPEQLIQFKQLLDNVNEKKMREIIERRSAPTLIISDTSTTTATIATESKPPKNFIEEVDKTTKVVSATRTMNLSNSILEGTIIHATLETAVNSDLPGSMRAIINRTIYSADGMHKLLNPGDRLVMKYSSKISQGATRIFAVGSRIIKADGISINLGSEIASPLGAVGIGADSVDTHFFERFSEASLMAVISAGAATMNVSDQEQLNSLSMYRSSIAESFSETAAGTLKQNNTISPTLHVGQGKEITVFVAKDINFDGVYGESA